MLGRAVVYIDGNNFYHCLKGTGLIPGAIDFHKLSQLVCEHFNFACARTIYYNSVPDISDGQEMYYNHLKFLDGIRKLPRFEVRTRKLQKMSTAEMLEEKRALLSGLGLCGRCGPLMERHFADSLGHSVKREKGIDVMIAVDMLEGAIKDEYDCCVLISGDADFVPALNLIRSNGKETCSAFLHNGYSHELRDTHKFFVLKANLISENCLKDGH